MKRIIALLIGCGIVLGLIGPGYAGNYVWKQSDKTPSFGDVTVTYDQAGDVSTLSKAAGGQRANFSGGDISFADGGAIRMNGGELAFSNNVSMAGAMSVASADATGEDREYSADFITATPVLAFPGVALDDCDMLGAYLDTGAGRGWAAPYFIQRGDGWMRAEFQMQASSFVKGVIITLTETAEGLLASCENCSRYYTGTAGSYEFALAPGGKVLPLVTDPTSSSGYGADRLKIRVAHNVASSVDFAGDFTPAGSLAVSGKKLTASFEGCVGNDGVVEHSLAVTNATLSFVEHGELTFQGDLIGTNAVMRFSHSHALRPIKRTMTINQTAHFLRRASLDDVMLDGISVEIFKQGSGGDEYTKDSPGTTGFEVCFVNKKSDGIYFQVQYGNTGGGNWNKCLHVRMFQQGEDIYVQGLKSYWIKLSVCPVGTYDMVDDPNGYASQTGDYYLHSGDNTYWFKNISVTYSGTETKMDRRNLCCTNILGTTACTLAENALLENVQTNNISARALRQGTTSTSNTINDYPTICFVEKNSDGICFQVQGEHDNWIKCAYVRIYQDGTSLKIKSPKSYWVKSKFVGVGEYDMVKDPDNRKDLASAEEGKLSSGTDTYGVDTIDVEYLGYGLRLRMPGASENLVQAAIDLEEGVAMVVNSTNAFPHGGEVNVHSGARLDLACNSTIKVGVGNGKTRINVSTNGFLAVRGAMTLRSRDLMQVLRVDGGVADFQYVNSVKPVAGLEESLNYVNLLSLSNGGRLTGRAVLVCDTVNANWHVSGTEPSAIDVGILLVGGVSSTQERPTLVWDVADVTGDGEVDAFMNGRISNWPNVGNDGVKMCKNGAGTLRLGGADCAATGRVEVAAGTLLLGATNALNPGNLNLYPDDPSLNILYQSKQALLLSGGTIASETNLVNTALSLSVSKSSGIDLADDSTLAIDAVGTVSAPLSVTLGSGARLRIGTSRCIADSVLRQITVNGRRAIQDNDGYVIAAHGTVLIVR